MSTQPHKKPRLIIIKKEQDENVVTYENEVPAVGGRTPQNEVPAVGGRTPPRTPRSTAVGGKTLACTRFNNKTWQEREQWLATNRPIYEQTYKRPLKCIYGCPREISHSKFAPQQNILVIEMNNDENKIQGIGMIKNQTANEVYRTPSAVVSFATAHSTPPSGTVLNPDKNHAVNRTPSLGDGPPGGTPGGTHPTVKFNIFSDRNYARYIYIGNTHYATRDELIRNHTPDAQYINEHLTTQLPHQESVVGYLERLLFKGPRHMKRGSGITNIKIESNII